MRYTPEHKEQTRQRVLDEAAKVVLEGGAKRLSVGGVMARASLTHGGFYAHFSSKDDLVGETIAMMVGRVIGRYERATRDRPPREALQAYVEAYLSPRHRDNKTGICPLPAITVEIASLGEQPQRCFERGLGMLIAGLTDHMREIGVADPEDVASSVAAELVGGIALARAVSDREQSDQILERSRRSVLRRLGIEPSASAGGWE